VARWVPYAVSEAALRNRIKNKMIRPTTIPDTLEELQLEQALAREALRLALEQHRQLAVGLRGVQQDRTISDAFTQAATGQSLIDLWKVNLIIGSGGILSHAPRRVQSLLMLLDAFQPLGITQLAVDSIFMMPHLGVLSTVHEQAALDVFEHDCLVPLGTAIAPAGAGRDGEPCLAYRLALPDGSEVRERIACGEVRVHPLAAGATARAALEPARGMDLGAGRGRPLEAEVAGGAVGVVVDARGRPLELPGGEAQRIAALKRWAAALSMYPE